MAKDLEKKVTLSLNDRLSSKLSGISGKLAKFSTRAQGISKRFTNAGSSVTSAGKKFAIFGGVVAGAGVGVFALLKKQADFNDELAKTAPRIGLTTDAIQKVEVFSRLGGATNADVTTAFRSLSKAMSEARDGTVTYTDAFAKVGITGTKANGELKSSQEIMLEIADAFKGMENGAEKTALAQELLGRGGTKLINTLNGGSEAIKKQGERLSSLGGVLDKEILEQSEKFNDSLLAMTTVATTLGTVFSSKLIPKLTPLIDRFTEWLGSAEGGQKVIADLTQTIKDLVKWWRELNPIIQKSIVAFTLFAPVIAGVLIPLGFLISSIGSLIAFLGALSTGLGVVIGAFGTLAGLISGPVLLAIGALVAVTALIVANWEKVKVFFSSFFSFMEAGFGLLGRITSTILGEETTNDIKIAWGGLSDFFSIFWRQFKEQFSGISTFVGETIQKITDWIDFLTENSII